MTETIDLHADLLALHIPQPASAIVTRWALYRQDVNCADSVPRPMFVGEFNIAFLFTARFRMHFISSHGSSPDRSIVRFFLLAFLYGFVCRLVDELKSQAKSSEFVFVIALRYATTFCFQPAQGLTTSAARAA